jgi:hypothetical protein
MSKQDYLSELAQEFSSKLSTYFDNNEKEYQKLGIIVDGL